MDVMLTAETGRPRGTRAARRLRREGRVPGVVYGLGRDPIAVSVGWPELRVALTTEAGLNALIDLEVDGESALTIVKELQRDPVKRSVTHVDFIRIDPDAEIEVEVPLVLTGEPEKLTHEGGLVDQLLHSIRIRAKPGQIPNELVADITELTTESAIKVGDVELPPNVSTDVDPDEPVVTGYVPRAEVAEVTEAAEAAEGEAPAEGEAAEEAAAPTEGEASEGSAEGGEG